LRLNKLVHGEPQLTTAKFGFKKLVNKDDQKHHSIVCCKMRFDILNRLGGACECDGQTNRQTDGQTNRRREPPLAIARFNDAR